MAARSKIVDVKGTQYEVRRLAPEVGSFIFMRMLGLSFKARNEQAERAEVKKTGDAEAAPAEPISGEMQVRALSFSVMSGAIGFDDFKFIQSACIKNVSRQDESTGFFMPVMTDAGQWTKAGEELESNVGSVMSLTTEVLILCFADFFESPGLGT